jgi:RHS repeat-associated protein
MMTDQTRHDRTSQSAAAVGALQRGETTTLAYDAWGRLAARAQGGYAAEYGYRYGSRLHEATSNFPSEEDVTFEYRGDGRLYQRTVGASDTVYRYGMGWDPLVEEDGSGYVLGAWAMTPGGARGKKLAYMFGGLNGGLPIYGYHDHLGSIRRTRWTNKSSFGRDEFDPYGGVYATEGLAFMLRHFASHPEDPALQAYRAPYRTYSPGMARWMTRDPLGMIDGPNVYGYVGSRPLSVFDPLGTAGCDAELSAVFAACGTSLLAALSSSIMDMAVCIHCAKVCVFGTPLACAVCAAGCIGGFIVTNIIGGMAEKACQCTLRGYLNCSRRSSAGLSRDGRRPQSGQAFFQGMSPN